MNFFDGSDYRINKLLLSMIGQWPYQTAQTKYIIWAALALLAGTQVIAKICAIVTSFNQIDAVLENMAPLFADVVAAIKLINSAIQVDKMKQLLNRIQVDFASCSTEEELQILKQYAEDGRRYTIMYGGFLYSIMIIFMITPMKPFILHTVNGTEDRPFVHYTEYFIDSQKYYYPIVLHSYVTIFVCVTSVVTVDAMFMIFIQHACALFTALGNRLYNLVEDESFMEINQPIENDKSFKSISKCVFKHNQAIEFADLIESHYSTSLFIQAGINTLGMSASGVQAIMYMNESSKFITQVLFSYAQLIHLFFECVNGQRLINHSELMHEHLIHVKWYQTSLRTKKVINFMLVRARLPSKLTGANMFDISMETFSVILRTSMSYFTVMKST